MNQALNVESRCPKGAKIEFLSRCFTKPGSILHETSTRPQDEGLLTQEMTMVSSKLACCTECMPQVHRSSFYAAHSVKPGLFTCGSCAQVHMLEEVVRQLSHDLSVAEKAVGSSQVQADAHTALRALPAAEGEVKALNARVSCR